MGYFFGSIPGTTADFTEDQIFEWKLPQLVHQFKNSRLPPPSDPEQEIGDTARPEKPDERVLWPGFTAREAKQQAKTRASNFQRQEKALQAKQQSQDMTRSRKSQTTQAQDSPDQSSQKSGSEEGQGAIPAGDNDFVAIGDVMLFSPDKESQAMDARSGYKLQLNIGQVCELDHSDNTARLWWYFSSSQGWTAKTSFVPWRDNKTHHPYKDWVKVDSLLQDSWGTLVKVQLVRVSGREG